MKKQILLAALLLSFAISAFSQGIIVPRDNRSGLQPLKVSSQVVDVSVRSNVAITEVEQVFLNSNSMVMEGTYIFPVPKGASVTEFYLWIDGKKVKGELLEKENAAKIYRDIVNRMKDPALLELSDFNIFKASIFPIPPGGERKIALKFSQALEMNSNLLAYDYPLRTRSSTLREPIGKFIFTMKIESAIPVLNAYSPTHNMEVQRKNDRNITLGFEKDKYLPETDLQVYLSLSKEDVGLSFASFKELSADDGYFMMMLSPKVDMAEKRTAAKDVIFVLDTSGSMMDNGKITQAVNALKFGVMSLNEKDRFGLITYATTVNPFRDELLPASEENKLAVVKHLGNVSATGATNIHDALKTGFAMFSDSSRPRYLIFLTDGLPTAVERDPKIIAQRAREWSKDGIRLFSWGVGFDVNAVLLDTLARDHKGASEYVKPQEEMELKMSHFFEKIAFPVMTDLSLKFEGITVQDYYPLQLPDLFKGSNLVLFGRFQGDEKGKVILKGRIGDKKVEFSQKIAKNRIEDGQFVANLWATRKVGFLLEEIRINGENKEIKDEVIRIAKKYGIVTPYTSYLVTEPAADEQTNVAGGVRRNSQNAVGGVGRRPQPKEAEETTTITGEAPLVRDYKYELSPETGEMEKKRISSTTTGKDAVDTSKQLQEAKEADKLDFNAESNTRKIGEKTFLLKEGVWTDSLYTKELKTKEIQFGSDEYFQLIKKNKMMAKWLALGDKVIIVLDKVAFIINK